jgi:SAM-dependent methyltransferase
MTAIPLEASVALLACPRCASRLRLDGGYSCTQTACEFAAGFPTIAGRWPVLADPDIGVVDPAFLTAPDAAPAPHPVRALLTAWLRRLVRPRNAVAAAQLQRLRRTLGDGALVLVIGGGTVGNGADEFLADDGVRVLAFDIYPTEQVQFIADAHTIPLRDATVDAVVIQAVLEHVLDPTRVVSEIHRVLRPDGLVYAETPFMQQVHAGAYDFTRFSDSGHRWLFRRFEEVDRGVVAGVGTTLSWSIDHYVRALTRSRTAGRLARLLFFWVRFADRFSDDAAARDGASAVYFLGRRSERELAPKEILAAYRGAQSPPPTLDGTTAPRVE